MTKFIFVFEKSSLLTPFTIVKIEHYRQDLIRHTSGNSHKAQRLSEFEIECILHKVKSINSNNLISIGNFPFRKS